MTVLKKVPTFPLLNRLWPPLLTVLVNHCFFGTAYFTDLPLLWQSTLLTLPLMVLLSQAQIRLSHHLRQRYPRFEQRKARFAAWTFISLPLTLVVIFALWLLHHFFLPFGLPLRNSALYWAFLLGAVTHIISLIVNEGQFTYLQWKQAIIEAERLEKINWESRYEGLKQQVNPHFLFNSINTLSSLIYEDRASAGRYVKEMSQVYRYLLRSNDNELVTLQTELDFIQSYFHLLKTRFGAALSLQQDVPQRFRHWLLPPLTLQMLVENAVKHNHLSKEALLLIRLTCNNEGWLQVQNNLQRKQGRVDSTGIGLANIREKYMLLGLPGVQLKNDGLSFTVLLPLVAQHSRLKQPLPKPENSTSKREELT